MAEPAKPDNSVKTTLITVAGSILVALLTTVGTIATNSGGIKANTEKLDTMSKEIGVLEAKADALKKQDVPVGTVIASLLNQTEFAQATGDPDDFDVTKSKWTLADGKTVHGTAWAKLRSDGPVPNLCGVFLRGKNNGKREGLEEVSLGDYRPDTVGPHSHELKLSNPQLPGGGLLWDGGRNHSEEPPSGLVLSSKGVETQPKNITVNFYIRINE